jgi:hypothetical protein|tara:strand:- start:937 stop:1152 length:216 start_codon:yes stop_codon:yes gene_type:complete
MSKKSKAFEKLKKELIQKEIKDSWMIPIWKLQYKGKGRLITNDMVQKVKLLDEQSYLAVKRTKFLMYLKND